MQSIELQLVLEKIIIACPYDAELIEQIKYLPSKSRSWIPRRKVWLIDRSPKLLNYCRYICHQCCLRRNWLFIDRDLYTKEELELCRNQIHRQLATGAISSVQPKELVILGVEGNFIHLCFNKKVSNDTFWAVKNAAFDEYYPRRFLFFYTNKLVKLLVEKECLNLKYQDYKIVYKNLNIGIIHLVDLESGCLWLGRSSSESVLIYKDFTIVDDRPFQLFSLLELFQGFFRTTKSITQFKHFLFANELERSSSLEYLFYNLPLEIKCRRDNGSKNLNDYYCDLDPILDFFDKQKSDRQIKEIYPLFGVTPAKIAQIIRQVTATKESRWIQHVLSLKQTAINDFTSRFYDILTKEDIIQILINHSIDYRKSWNKGKLWRALTNSSISQSLAEKYLALPILPPHPQPTDAVLGGLYSEPSPQSTDAVLGRQPTSIYWLN